MSTLKNTLFVLSGMTTITPPATPTQTLTLHYSLYSENKEIGKITSEHNFIDQDGMTIEQISTNTKMDLSGWWGSWSLRAESRYVFSDQTIMRFDHKITEDKKNFHITGEKHDTNLWASIAEIKTQKQISDEEFFNLALAVTASVLLSSTDGLDDIGLGHQNKDSGKGIEIPFNAFTTTLEKLPHFSKYKNYQFSNTEINVLDTEELRITHYKLNSIGKEVITLFDQTYDCHVIKAKSSKTESTYWITESAEVPILIKEEGLDEDGPYSITLKDLSWK